MGVDVTHIIRHEFKGVKNHRAAMAFVNEAVQKLKINLQIIGVDK